MRFSCSGCLTSGTNMDVVTAYSINPDGFLPRKHALTPASQQSDFQAPQTWKKKFHPGTSFYAHLS